MYSLIGPAAKTNLVAERPRPKSSRGNTADWLRPLTPALPAALCTRTSLRSRRCRSVRLPTPAAPVTDCAEQQRRAPAAAAEDRARQELVFRLLCNVLQASPQLARMWLLTANDHQKALAFEILRLCLPAEQTANAEAPGAQSGALDSIAEEPGESAVEVAAAATAEERVEVPALSDANEREAEAPEEAEPEVRQTRHSRARTALTIQFSGGAASPAGARSDSRLSTCLASRTPPAVEHTRVGSACHIRDREANRDILILHSRAN